MLALKFRGSQACFKLLADWGQQANISSPKAVTAPKLARGTVHIVRCLYLQHAETTST